MELFLRPPESTEIIGKAKETIKKILASHHQPTAVELVCELEHALGWYVRHVYCQVIAEMRDDKTVSTHLRDYLKTTLSDENIIAALREGTKPTL